MITATITPKTQQLITDTSSQDIELPIPSGGKMVCYDLISVVDDTTSPDMITLGFKDGPSEWLIESFTSPAAGAVVCTAKRLFVPARYKPFARVKGGDAKDVIKLFAFGYISDRDTVS